MDPSALMALFGEGSTGADVSDLTAFKNTVQQNDPWRIAAAPVFGAKFDTSTWSPGATFGVSAGQAFLGGVLNALGQRSEARQLESVASVLPELYSNPMSVGVPEGVDPEAFGQLKLQAIARGSKSNASQMSKIFEELFGAKVAGLTAAEQEKGKVKGRKEAYGTDVDPENPQFKMARELEKDTAARITKLPSYIQFSDIDANFRTLKELAKEDSRPAAVGMISALARIWDPVGTVREGEYAINSQAQSALDAAYGNWREIVMGKGKLSAEGKRAIISAASRKYNEFGAKYLSERDKLYEALERQGGLRENIPTPGYEPFDIQSLFGGGALTQELYNAERARGLSKEQIKAKYGGGGGPPVG